MISWETEDHPEADDSSRRRRLLEELRPCLDPSSHPGSAGNLDHYEVVDFVGAGPRTVVVMAWDTAKCQYVAIKLVRPELAEDPLACNRLADAAQRIQRIQHEHIYPIHEVAARSRGVYFVMPLAERGSLLKRLSPGVPLPSDSIQKLARQTALALLHAHSRGILHDNLKPSNLLQTGEDSVALMDFGLSSLRGPDALKDTSTAEFGSRVFYVAPETIGKAVSSKSADIYSFGAMLYEWLSGVPPHPAKTVQEVLKQIAAGPPPLIVDVHRTAHFGLAAVSKAAMGRTPETRYPDFSFVLADLDRIARSQPPLGASRIAPPPPPRRGLFGLRIRR